MSESKKPTENEAECGNKSKPLLEPVNHTQFAVIYIGVQIVFFGSWYLFGWLFAECNRKANGELWTEMGEFFGIFPAVLTTIIFIKIALVAFRFINNI